MNKKLPCRKTIALKDYDYSQNGIYFVTICTFQKTCIFGEINEKGSLILNSYGVIAYNEWFNTLNIRNNIRLGNFIVMPNHIHGIVIIDTYYSEIKNNDLHQPAKEILDIPQLSLNKFISPYQTIGSIIRGYKSAVTKQINSTRLNIEPVWQRGYYDHIIRNKESYIRISNYINSNPVNWLTDENYL